MNAFVDYGRDDAQGRLDRLKATILDELDDTDWGDPLESHEAVARRIAQAIMRPIGDTP